MTEQNEKGDNLNKRQIKSKGQSNIDNPEKLVTLEAHKKTKTNKVKNKIHYVLDTTMSKQTQIT